MTKAKTPRNLGNVLSDVYRRIGMTDAYEEYKAIQIWESIVGETIAQVTRVEKIENGDLYVKVRNPAWRMELNFRKKEIALRLNQETGKEMIRNIIFR